MIFGKSKLELQVGIFVFIALAILVTFVLLIGDFKTWTAGHQVNFIFNFANGVKIGAPVRFAGVDIGEVKDIKFVLFPEEQKTKIKIMGWVKKDIKIPFDSTIWINTLGLLGEKYIEIIPGPDYSRLVAANETLTGNDPIAMHEVTQLARDVIGNINEAIVKMKNKEGTLGKLLYDDEIYNELNAAAQGIEALILDIQQHPWKLFFKPKEKPVKK